MQCAKCNTELAKVKIREIEVDQCPACFGAWFDFGELKQILAIEEIDQLRSVAQNNAGADEKTGHCPRCGGTGNMVPVKNLEYDIHIDTCPVCYGQWLDGDELEKLKKKGLLESVAGFFRKLLS